MPDRTQYISRIIDPDTEKVVRWQKIVIRGTECEPASGFAPVGEGGNPNLQNTTKPGGGQEKSEQKEYPDVDCEAASRRADAVLGLEDDEAPWWAD